MIFKYTRCSTKEQDNQLQLDAMKQIQHDELFEDYQTGRSTDRPELNKLRQKLRAGDELYCYDISRLARNVKHLLIFIDELNELGVKLVVIKEQIDTTTTMGRLMVTLLGAVAEMESSNISQKVKDGMKASSSKAGRQAISFTTKQKKLIRQHLNGQITATDCIKLLGVGRTTFYKYINLFKDKNLVSL